jgi:DNA-binding response OmpR family regulator
MTKNILIIEDDDFFRELIRKKLSSQDFKVSEAINGEDGLIMIKEERPDLILLDLLLPNIDGFEVLSKIKLDPNNSLIPVIILSNLGQQEDIER